MWELDAPCLTSIACLPMSRLRSFTTWTRLVDVVVTATVLVDVKRTVLSWEGQPKLGRGLPSSRRDWLTYDVTGVTVTLRKDLQSATGSRLGRMVFRRAAVTSVGQNMP